LRSLRFDFEAFAVNGFPGFDTVLVPHRAKTWNFVRVLVRLLMKRDMN